MYPHRIRLRGPWECEPVARLDDQSCHTAELPAPIRMTMPCRFRDVGLAGFAGRVRLRRRFGYPGQIDENERVWLTIAGLTEDALIILNGQKLGRCAEQDCPCEWEITPILQPRNELLVYLGTHSDNGGLWGEVALEIRRTAFLRCVQARVVEWGLPHLFVDGELIGVSERPLDLYLLVGTANLAYTSIWPMAEGSTFQLVSRYLPPLRESNEKPHLARVELIDGAVVWYSLDVPFAWNPQQES